MVIIMMKKVEKNVKYVILVFIPMKEVLILVKNVKIILILYMDLKNAYLVIKQFQIVINVQTMEFV